MIMPIYQLVSQIQTISLLYLREYVPAMKRIFSLILSLVMISVMYSCDSKDRAESDSDVIVPQITGITTDYFGKAVSGKPVTLTGSDFSPSASDNKVLFGVGLEVTSVAVKESSDSHMVFLSPHTSNESLLIRVSVKGRESDSVTLEFDNSFADEPVVDLSPILNNSKTVTVREGVEWLSFHGYWEGKIRNINIVKTTLNEHNRLGIYYEYKSEPDGYNIDDKCEYLDALVGTNGPMACCQFVRVDGEVKRAANKKDPWIVNSALTIDDGIPDIVKVKDNYDAARLPNSNVGTGGPLLVYEGKIQKYPQWEEEAFLKTEHPRTAFGMTRDQKTVFHVAVDGRYVNGPYDKTAIGLPTDLLSKLMRGLGCWKAMNFDGGGGTAMWVYGHGLNGIVNHPCDGLNWDNPTLRPCGNAIYIYSDLK